MTVLEALACLLALRGASCPASQAEPASARVLAAACDVVFLDASTILVADWDGEAQVSLDGGATWEAHAMHTWTRELTVDPKQAIWSLYYWRGIHEPSRAELVHSKNRGRVWTTVPWPAERALPVDFLTQAGDEPVLLDDAGRCWRHEAWGEETIASWKALGEPVPEHAGTCGLVRGHVFYVATRSEVWLSTDSGRAWTATGGPHGVVALQPIPRARPDEPERAAAATDAGEIHTVEIGTRAWKRLGSFPAPHYVSGIAATAEGVWVAGETRSGGPLGGRVDRAGRWYSLEGLPRGQSNAIRTAPDGRVWIACGGLYAAAEGAERWERVGPK